ncbi:hypothetical protein MO867_21770, partial [Microbulbifer sp. OS29]
DTLLSFKPSNTRFGYNSQTQSDSLDMAPLGGVKLTLVTIRFIDRSPLDTTAADKPYQNGKYRYSLQLLHSSFNFRIQVIRILF